MNFIQFLMDAMKEGKTQLPSTKRIGHMTGIFVAALIATSFMGIIVGLSIDIAQADFQFVYSQLLNTILILVGMLLGAGTTAYVATKKTENKDTGNGTNEQ